MSKSYELFQKIISTGTNSTTETMKLVVSHLKSNDGAEIKEIVITASVKYSVVTAIAAFDKYYTDRFCEALLPFLRKSGPTKDLATMLEKAGLNIYSTLELVKMKRPHSRIRSLLANYLRTYVTQSEKKIDDLFKCYGLKNFLENSEKLSKIPNLRKRIFELVKLRHLVVHEGDVDKNGNIKHVNTKECKRIAKSIVEIKYLVDASESILNQKGI